MKDSLGDRMKEYENVTRTYLSNRSYTIIRVDGKAFHTYTKGLKRPFDEGLIDDMNSTAIYLCENIMGAKLAYVQSDEISILVTDFDTITTQSWLKNNTQKMVSISASMATAKFNQLRLLRNIKENFGNFSNNPIDSEYEFFETVEKTRTAEFDARIFQIPQKTEVENNFIWRQQDATRNSIAAVAQSFYSHKELNGKNSDEQQEMIFQKGTNWNDYPIGQKRGRIIEKVTFVNGVDVRNIPNQEIALGDTVRNKWVVTEPPVFTQDKNYLNIRIPENR